MYVEDRPVAHLFKAITQEIARLFDRGEIGEAIRACVERSPEFIREYLEENFRLSPPEAAEPEATYNAPPEQPSADDVAVNEIEESDTPEPSASDSAFDVTGVDGVTTNDVDGDPDANAMVDDDVNDDHGDLVGDGEQTEDADNELEDEGEVDDDGDHEPKPSPPRRTPKPLLIDLMAAAAGFTKDGTDRFFHQDGGWIQKASGNTFQWERYSAAGELTQSYWVKDCCIERESLQLDAAIWNLCERFPDQYSIVLRDPSEKAIAYSGTELVRLRSSDRLTLHPANYRLVYHHSDTSSTQEGGQHD